MAFRINERIGADKIAVIFTIIMFVAYLSTMSISMDDEDGIHFAIGLQDFNILLNHPHWPGFHVFILLGRVFFLFIGSDLLTLTFMSALFGALSIYILYLLAKDMLDKKAALVAAMLTAFTPMFWLVSLEAMSDMTGLFFVLASLLMVYKYTKHGNGNHLLLGAVLSGIAVGVRIHSLFILLPVIAFALFARKSETKTKLWSIALFFIVAAACYLPVVMATGAQNYIDNANAQFKVWSNPEVMSIGPGFSDNSMVARAVSFLASFIMGAYGIDLSQLGLTGALILAFLAVILLAALKNARKIRDTRVVFILSASLLYTVFIFATLPPINPRYLLILVPMISMLLASTILGLKISRIFAYSICGVLAVLLLAAALPLAVEIHTAPAPAVQMLSYINQSNMEGRVFLFNGFLSEYTDYYNINISMTPYKSCDDLKSVLAGNTIALSVMVPMECGGLKYRIIKTTERTPAIHLKRPALNLYEIAVE